MDIKQKSFHRLLYKQQYLQLDQLYVMQYLIMHLDQDLINELYYLFDQFDIIGGSSTVVKS